MIKVLNLYAGIGGNRKLWKNVEVTAIENNKEIAKIYKDFFHNDQIIVTNAHQYLLNHYKEFDFIWSSPPCPTHSRTNIFLNPQGIIRYPDMSLYQEILFLKQWFKGNWVVENVIPYYKPLINPTVLLNRHYFWSNFNIIKKKIHRGFNYCNARGSTRIPDKDHLIKLQKYHGFNISKYKIKNKLLLLRNCVHSELGLHIFNCAFKTIQKRLE